MVSCTYNLSGSVTVEFRGLEGYREFIDAIPPKDRWPIRGLYNRWIVTHPEKYVDQLPYLKVTLADREKQLSFL